MRTVYTGLLLVCLSAQAVAANYGALAYSHDNGSYGYSYDFSTQWAADERARQECGYGCKIVVQFHDACAAYATGHGTNYGWAVESTSQTAKDRALYECSIRGGGCAVRVWGCTTRY